MGFGNQLKLLLWKNFTLRKRQPLRIVVELLWPLFLFAILAWVRTRGLMEFRHQCHFDDKAMPSAGPLPFLQSFLCTANNTCNENIQPGELPGGLDTFNSSLISMLYYDIEKFLGNKSEIGSVTRLLEDVDVLLKLQQAILNETADCQVQVGDLVLDTGKLRQQIKNQNLTFNNETINEIIESNINITVVLDWLFDDSIPPDELPSVIVDKLCSSQTDDYLLRLPNSDATSNLKETLCATSFEELFFLVYDLRQDIDAESLFAQIEKCAIEHVGSGFNADIKMYDQVQGIWKDLKGLESLQSLISQINNSIGPIREMSPREILTNTTREDISNLTSIFTRVVCGRPMEFLEVEQKKRDMSDGRQNANKGIKLKNDDDKDIDYVPDLTTTEFCNDLFEDLMRDDRYRVIWKQLKPLIRGKLLYTPDTPLTRKIVRAANRTFSELAEWKKFAQDWLMESPKIYEYMSNNSRIDNLRKFTTQGLKFVPDNKNLRTMHRWLYNGPKIDGQYDWRDSVNYTDYYSSIIVKYLDCFQFNKWEPVDSENELVKLGLQYMNDSMLWAGIVFDVPINATADPMPSHITYKIRMDMSKVDTTEKFRVSDRYWTPGPRARPLPDMKYLVHGFALLQDMIEHGIIKLQTGLKEDIGIYVQQFPYPCYIYDKFVLAISRSMPLFMTLAWIYTVSMIVKGIVYEKEQRLKEVMKVMGLGNGVHWLAWFITSFIMMIISIFFLVIILKAGKVLKYSDMSVVFVLLLSFTVSTIMLCFFLSTLFSRANLAAASAGLIYFCTYLPYSFCTRWEEYMTWYQKVIACLLSNVSFGFGCSYFARYEEQGTGVQWSNVAHSPIPDDDFNMRTCIIMMCIDGVIYGLLAWYIEAVFPGQYGMPRPWYFFVTKSYWCGRVYKGDGNDDGYSMNPNNQVSEDFEDEPSHIPVGVSIKGLRKVYKDGNKVAVDGLNLNFYEGQITSFLGHNGAGKTTTMSILTGLFPPTQGTAYIYGKDICKDVDSIRQSLGMCPQHNVLFDLLTVEEHLWFYGQLKSNDKEALTGEIEQMIKDVGLPHKRDEMSTKLSGGMKRKLSVAIAFVAKSRLVILDEPTAGVDPYARRSIWDLLLKYRHNRTIVLSTHFMDEADMLGDRIAIISQGKLCCCGSSLFLKSRFGSGYYLTLVKHDNEGSEASNGNELTPPKESFNGKLSAKSSIQKIMDDEGVADVDGISVTHRSNTSDNSDQSSAIGSQVTYAGCNEKLVTKFITSVIPDAVLMEDIGTELCYQIPDDEARTGAMQDLFTRLDENLDSLGISSYGISDTTLEEVFLRVADESGVDEELPLRRDHVEQLTDGGQYARPVTRLSFRSKMTNFLGNRGADQGSLVAGETVNESDIPDSIKHCNGAGSYRINGMPLVGRHILAIFIKRFHNIRRSKKGFISEVVLPAVFICLAMVFAMINPPVPEEPPMEIHPWLLSRKATAGGDHNLFMFYSNDNPSLNWTKAVEKSILSDVGVGTRCMDPSVYHIDGFKCEPDKRQTNWTPVKKWTPNATKECSCDKGYQICPEGAEGPDPSSVTLGTTDVMYNMTSRNITDWLIKTTARYRKVMYGGLAFGDRNPLVTLNVTEMEELIKRLIVAANGNTDPNVNVTLPPIIDDLEKIVANLATRSNAKIWFNNKGYVSIVGYMNIMNNALLRAHLPPDKKPEEFGITLYNHPMNRTSAQLENLLLEASVKDLLIAISVIFAMSFIPASFILFLVEERKSNAKHLQFVSGINPTTYWVANYMWDLVNYLIPCLLCIFIFLAFQQEAYVSAQNAPCLIALLILYGWAVTPMMYPASFLFDVPSSAMVGLSCMNVFLGIVSTISTFVLEVLQNEDPELKEINDVLKIVFLVLPHYCLGRGLMDMTTHYAYTKFPDLAALLGVNIGNPIMWDVVGKNLFCLFIEGIVFFLLNLAFQYRFWCNQCCTKKSQDDDENVMERIEDEDVARERRRVMADQANSDVLTIRELVKRYGTNTKKHPAVDGICVGVHKGECFGLLGVNGAGKTTTFKMLTGDISVTSGDAELAKHSILTNMVDVQQNLGYCPQFDALFALLTGREHLEYFARLRGVPEKDVKVVAEWGIRKLGLLQYADRSAGSYSGGNKRKLSTAIALVGNPHIIFLDEPTTGMDPKARRFLWNTINAIVKDGRSVVLTSHSMEECEALCNRIAIMVNGTFKCLGSIQHLKNRFGNGYTVIVRIKGQEPDMQPILTYMKVTFPLAELRENHHNMLQYQFPAANTHLATVFGQLQNIKDEFNIEDYSVSQTTLDQVFINFAKLQTDLLDDEIDPAVIESVSPQRCPSPVDGDPSDPYAEQDFVFGDGDDRSLSGSTIGLILPDNGQTTPQPERRPTSGELPNISIC